MKTIGIFPASGGLGGSTVRHLVNQVPSSQVTFISRYPDKTRSIPGTEGATFKQASYESPASQLEEAFRGLDTLFLISYPSHVRDYRVKVQLPAIDAAHRAGVKHVFYSSLAFALPDKPSSLAEVMQAHLESERRLREIAASDPGFSWTSIREGLYHESFPIYTSFWTLDRPSDKILIPHDGGGPGVSWAKRDELGEASAKLIAQYAKLDSAATASYPWTNSIVALTGPREWTLGETVEVLGKAVGKEVAIQEVTVDEWLQQPHILGYFGTEEKARTWATAWAAIRDGETAFVSPALEEILGRRPEELNVTIEQMAKP